VPTIYYYWIEFSFHIHIINNTIYKVITILKWLLTPLTRTKQLAIEVDDEEVPTQGRREMPLVDRFTALANITSTNLDDHDIVSLNFTRFVLN
jgi:hypothetical protein